MPEQTAARTLCFLPVIFSPRGNWSPASSNGIEHANCRTISAGGFRPGALNFGSNSKWFSDDYSHAEKSAPSKVREGTGMRRKVRSLYRRRRVDERKVRL